MNAGEFPEVTATAGGCSDCWKLRQLLEAVTGCRQSPQYDGKCPFYFDYFFRTTPTNRDLRQKDVYFPARPVGNFFNIHPTKIIIEYKRCRIQFENGLYTYLISIFINNKRAIYKFKILEFFILKN